ncbi:MAG TPA: DinB family protein [Vicinamibacterales bacterium]|nr:DinB family protein [Vicinamibacterales bacterium]
MTRGLMAIGLTCVLAASVHAQGARPGGGRGGRGAAAPAITTLAGDIQADWARTRTLITQIVEAMPDDKFNFKPTPAQQTFAQRVLHVSQTDLFILQTLGGKTPAPTINEKATTKAALLADLKQTFDYGEAVIKEFNDQQWVERVPPPGFMGSSASRVRIIYFDMQHSEDMYGQFVVYVRLNGVTPPASAGRRGGPPEP